MQDSHRQIIVGSIILIFTLLQFLVLAVFGYTPYPDSEGYLYLANENLGLNSPYPTSQQISELPFIWNLGTINMVYYSLKWFGSIVPVLLLYSLMKGLTTALIYAISLSITNHKTAFFILLLYVCYPANYGEGTSLLSEVPFIFLTLLSLWLLIRKYTITAGIALAIANWFRPFSLIFLFVYCLYLIYKNRRKIITLIIGYTAMIAVIGGINYYRTGYFIYQAKTGWMALMQYSLDNSIKKVNGNPMETDSLNCIEKDAYWKNQFTDWLQNNSDEYVRQIPGKIIKLYVSDNVNMCTFIPGKRQAKYMYNEVSMPTLIESFPRFSAVQILTLYNLVYYYLLIISFTIGCFLAWKHRHIEPLILSLGVVVVGTIFIALVGHGEARFHQPFMPFIIIMGGLLINKISLNNE